MSIFYMRYIFEPFSKIHLATLFNKSTYSDNSPEISLKQKLLVLKDKR